MLGASAEQPRQGFTVEEFIQRVYFEFLYVDLNRVVLNMAKKRFSLQKVGTSCFALYMVLRCCELSTV